RRFDLRHRAAKVDPAMARSEDRQAGAGKPLHPLIDIVRTCGFEGEPDADLLIAGLRRGRRLRRVAHRRPYSTERGSGLRRGDESARQGIKEGSRILAVEGRPVPAGIRVDALADIIRAAPGPVVRVRIQSPEGRVADYDLTRSPIHVHQEAARQPIPRDTRMAIRFLFSALGCVTLLACAVMLFIRRPRDPVAMLMSFAFLGMAATIDPPLLMWMAIGLTALNDVLSSAWWYLLVVALAAFPYGRFMPGWLRWIP